MKFLRFSLASVTASVIGVGALIGNVPLFEIKNPTPMVFEQAVSPEPVDIYCPGGFIQQGGETGTDIGKFDVIAKAELKASGEALATDDLPTEISAGVLLESNGQSDSQSTLGIVASTLTKVSSKRSAGLVASNCSQPASRGYLLSGDSQIGTESLLVISNPSQVETVVKISVLGISEIKSGQVVLAPSEQKYFSLTSLAGDSASYIVEFESSAVPVSVALQQRSISGLTPTGVDVSEWVASPGKELAFSAIKVLGSNLAPEESLSKPKIRIFNPTETQSSANITLVSASESKTVTVITEPNQLTETLLDLSDGNWSAFLTSNQEIFAAIKNPVFSTRSDFEWLNPTNAIEGQLAINSWPNSQLHLSNPTSEKISYDILGVGKITLEPFSRSKIDVPAGRLLVQSNGQIWAALTILNDFGYAVIEPKENKNFGANLSVAVH